MINVRYPVVTVRGVPVTVTPAQISWSNADWLRAALRESAVRGPTVVVDMSQTGSCDAAAFQVLARAHRRALAEGGELRLVVPHAALLRVLAKVGLDRLIPHFASLDDALADRPAMVAGQPPRAAAG